MIYIWVSLIVALLFWIIASILDSVMDTIKDHWDVSIFKDNPKFDEQWWNPKISWINKYENVYSTQRKQITIFGFKFTKQVQFTDAWHNLKMWKIISLAFVPTSIITGILLFLGVSIIPIIGIIIASLLILGLLWNYPFNIFYNKILKK